MNPLTLFLLLASVLASVDIWQCVRMAYAAQKKIGKHYLRET